MNIMWKQQYSITQRTVVKRGHFECFQRGLLRADGRAFVNAGLELQLEKVSVLKGFFIEPLDC